MIEIESKQDLGVIIAVNGRSAISDYFFDSTMPSTQNDMANISVLKPAHIDPIAIPPVEKLVRALNL